VWRRCAADGRASKSVPRKSPDTLLERAFSGLTGALGRARVPFMMIGGVAVIAHGVKRLTTDVDAVVQGNAVDVAALVRALARAGIAPRIERVELFARANLVLLMRHVETSVELDVSLAFTSFELEALGSRQQVRFGRVLAPMARPEVRWRGCSGSPFTRLGGRDRGRLDGGVWPPAAMKRWRKSRRHCPHLCAEPYGMKSKSWSSIREQRLSREALGRVDKRAEARLGRRHACGLAR
jgi:hypothetical protein